MNYQFSQAASQTKSSAVREILKLTQGKDIISLAGGLPAEEFFPVDAVRAACECVFAAGPGALQYGITEGYLPLRQALSERLAQSGIVAGPNNLLLTTGSQQAIDLVCRVLLDPGDLVLVQQPTYLAALQVFQGYLADVQSVPGDEFGMDMDALDASLRANKPKFVYVCPTFSNPTGHSWSLERRIALLDVCARHGVLILEDDPYGALYYDERGRFPTLSALNAQRTDADPGAVLYLGTFSKTVAPALRTGWAAGETELITKMAQAKQAADLHSSSLDQQTLYYLLRDFDLEGHLNLIRSEYAARMEVLATALRQTSANSFQFHEPLGGMFLWATLPEDVDAAVLLEYAVREGVAFVPGAAFHSGEPQRNTARLNFTHSNPANLAIGVQRLERGLERYRASLG